MHRPETPIPGVAEVLTACARADASEAARLLRSYDPGPRQLVDVAKYHGVLGTLSALLSGLDIPPRHATELDKWHKAIAIGQAVAALDLELLARAWNGQVTWTVIKGPALGQLYYPDPTWRMASDLDVLVPRDQMDLALARLESAGVSLDSVDWRGTDRKGIGEVSFHLSRRTALDLHWELIHEVRERRRFAVDVRSMIDRRIPVTLEGVEAWTLDDEDALAYVALHAMLSANTRLGWSVDLHRIVLSGRVDWPTLVQRCKESGLGLVLAVQLARARGRLGTPVSDDQLDALSRANSWRRLMRWADRHYPPEQTHEFGRHGQLLFRSTSRNTLQSAYTYARLAWPIIATTARFGSKHRGPA